MSVCWIPASETGNKHDSSSKQQEQQESEEEEGELLSDEDEEPSSFSRAKSPKIEAKYHQTKPNSEPHFWSTKHPETLPSPAKRQQNETANHQSAFQLASALLSEDVEEEEKEDKKKQRRSVNRDDDDTNRPSTSEACTARKSAGADNGATATCSADLKKRMSALERLKSMKVGLPSSVGRSELGRTSVNSATSFNPYAVKVTSTNVKREPKSVASLPSLLSVSVPAQHHAASLASRKRKAGGGFVDWDREPGEQSADSGEEDFQHALSNLHAPTHVTATQQQQQQINANFTPLGGGEHSNFGVSPQKRPEYWTQQDGHLQQQSTSIGPNRMNQMRNDNRAMMEYRKRIKGAANSLRKNVRNEGARNTERNNLRRTPQRPALRNGHRSSSPIMQQQPPKPKPPSTIDIQKKLETLSLSWEDVSMLNRSNLVHLVCWMQTKEQELVVQFNDMETQLTDSRLNYVDEQKSLAEAEWRLGDLQIRLHPPFVPPPISVLPPIEAQTAFSAPGVPVVAESERTIDGDAEGKPKKLLEMDLAPPPPTAANNQQVLSTLALFNQLAFRFPSNQQSEVQQPPPASSSPGAGASSAGKQTATKVPIPKLKEGEEAAITQWPPITSTAPPTNVSLAPPFVRPPPPQPVQMSQPQVEQQPRPELQLQRLMTAIAAMSKNTSNITIRPGPPPHAPFPPAAPTICPPQGAPTPLLARPIPPPSISIRPPPPPQLMAPTATPGAVSQLNLRLGGPSPREMAGGRPAFGPVPVFQRLPPAFGIGASPKKARTAKKQQTKGKNSAKGDGNLDRQISDMCVLIPEDGDYDKMKVE